MQALISAALLCAQILAGLEIDISARPGFYEDSESPVTISFENLGLDVGDRKVLNNVSGTFKHSHLIAVMGPSGTSSGALRPKQACMMRVFLRTACVSLKRTTFRTVLLAAV